MMNILVKLVAVCAVTVLSSCAGKSVSALHESGDTIQLKYAQHITMVRHDGCTVVALSNPWKRGAELHRYVLVARADSARMRNLPEGTVVYTPVRRSIVFTSPHCWLLGTLGAVDAIKGVCDLAYINLPGIQQLVHDGGVADCGNSVQPSVERIVSQRPQAIFVSPFEGVAYGQLDHIGVPLIECADYMETSALGRAEWMKFYGLLVGREAEADSLFAEVERNYDAWRTIARRSQVRPRVITERVVSGVWYCPGGRSSMGQLIADAGGQYVFAGDSHSGSLTLAPEKVIAQAADADRWLFVGSGDRLLAPADLAAEYPGYRMIRAMREGQVYECLPGMTNPYFEEMSFRPDFLLMDFVKIFHPDLSFGEPPHYYSRIGGSGTR